MKYLLLILTAITFFTVEAQRVPRSIYYYNMELTDPIQDTSLVYEDSLLRISFSFIYDRVNFSLLNKTSQIMKLNWNEASMSIFNKSQKVGHSGVKYNEVNASMPPSIIMAQTRLEDFMIPTANVYYNNGYLLSGWQTVPLLPDSDNKDPELKQRIIALKGSNVGVYLPISTTDGKTHDYSFVFRVRNVVGIDKKAKKETIY